jgi:prepilin-type N-terminal cleavage/methylation domain-containing protein
LNIKPPDSHQSGFTLIEIIAVLVIMGILAAVAVPKFFDLQERARRKAIYTAVSEIKVRVNQHFSSQLLDGRTAGQITYTAGSIDTNLGEDFLVSTWNEATNHITVDITYFPDPDDHTKSPMTRTETIEKPKIQ